MDDARFTQCNLIMISNKKHYLEERTGKTLFLKQKKRPTSRGCDRIDIY